MNQTTMYFDVANYIFVEAGILPLYLFNIYRDCFSIVNYVDPTKQSV